MLNLISKHFVPKAKNVESEVFFLKMQGDYFRYVAEVGTDERLQKASERALKYYNEAAERAEELSPADPTRLSLNLNFAVFCYENLQEQEQAVDMATEAYEKAAESMGEISSAKQ